MDPYTPEEGGAFKSKYRRLKPTPDFPDEDATHETVVIHAPYQSIVKYAPLGGRTNATNGWSVIKNDQQRAHVVHTDVVCSRAKDAAAVMGVRVNAAQGHFEAIQVIYISETFATFTFESKLYRVNAGSTITVKSNANVESLVKLTYSSTTGDATFSVITNGIETSTVTAIDEPTEDDTLVHLIVHFGDMIDDAIMHVDALENEEDQFVRTIYGLEHHASPAVVTSNETGEIFLPGLTDEQKNELLEYGVQELADKLNYYKRFALYEKPLVRPRYTIQAERKIFYSDEQESVPISLADGEYMNEANQTVSVLNGFIAVSALPLIKTHVRYVAVLDESFSHQKTHHVNRFDQKSIRSVKPAVVGGSVIEKKHIGGLLVSHAVGLGEVVFNEPNGSLSRVIITAL
jgi:hypothetical protein